MEMEDMRRGHVRVCRVPPAVASWAPYRGVSLSRISASNYLTSQKRLALPLEGAFKAAITNFQKHSVEEFSMTRKLVIWLAAFFLASITSQAQGKVELFGGYSYEHFNGSPSGNLNGWELSGQYKFASWVGGVADVDAHYGSLSGVNTRSVHFLFGPQISFPARVSPFFHVLIGGANIRGVGGTNTSFGTAVGAGIDSRIAPFLSWRIVQFDYLGTRFFHVTQNDVRISTGLVLRF